MPDLGKYLTELPEALTLDDDDILYTVVGSGTTTSKKVKKSTILSADRTARATAEGTIVANFASPYSTTTSYAVGDYCIKDLVLYKCISPTSGTWDSSKWTQVTALDLTSGVASDLADEIEARQSADETLQGEIDELPVDVQVDGGSLVNEDNIAVLDSLVAYGEASGEIATFSDGSDLAMKSLKVAIEPQQDLHGYDAPWVGGAGKNKYEGSPSFDGYEAKERWTLQTEKYNGHDVYKRGASWGGMYKLVDLEVGTYTFSCMCKTSDSATVNIFLKVTDITTADTDVTNISVRTSTSWTRISGTFNVTTAGTVALRVERSDNNGDIYISEYQLESGSTATAFAPYSNICPIIGWDEANVGVVGVNQWDEEWVNGYYNQGQFIFSQDAICCKNKISVKPNTNMYYVKDFSTVSNFYYTFYDINGNFLPLSGYDASGRYAKSASGIISVPNNAYYMTFNMGSAYGSTYNNDISINYPSTATAYEPYNGHTYTIQFTDGSNPLTVYGGYVDVVSGVLTVTWIRRNMGSLTYTKSQSGLFQTSFGDIKKPSTNTQPTGWVISSIYKEIDARSIIGPQGSNPSPDGVMAENEAGQMYFNNLAYTEVTDFKSAMDGVDLVYKLATPQTIQLTPTMVKSLLGVNNVWADCGDVDVSYVRDLTTTINYILEQLNS